jgi:hypothetical protein
MLALARAVLAAAEQQDHRILALELGEPVQVAVLIWQFEVGQSHSGLQLCAHRGGPPIGCGRATW